MLRFFIGFFLICNVTFGQVKEIVYSDPKDTTANFYISFKPTVEIKGILLLLTSFGESPQIAINESDIYKIATANGLITVFASLQYGTNSFFVDSLSQTELDNLIQKLFLKYSLKNNKFYLGGFSLGGAGVVKYAESAYSSNKLIKPDAVFAIDPPLDFERMYNSAINEFRNSNSQIAKDEAEYFISRLNYEFQSVPSKNLKSYHDISPYSYSDTTNNNIKNLIACPIMLLCEPDINWQIENRNRNLYDLNAIDCSAAINYLKTRGNSDASLIITSNKGYRKLSGKRNPHSWSIGDSKEIVNWLLKY